MRQILQHTWAVLNREEKRRFFLLSVLDILINIIDILTLAWLLFLIRLYIQADAGVQLSFLPGWLTDRNSLLPVTAFFFLFTVKNLAGFRIITAQFQFSSRVSIRLSGINLAGYQQSGFNEFINTDSSVHIRRIGFEPFDFSQYMVAGLQQIITQLSLITVSVVAILIFDLKLFFLLLLILLPPAAIVSYIIKKKLVLAKKNIQESNETSFRYLLDALKGFVEGNIYDRNAFFLRRFLTARERFSRYLFDSLALQNMPARVIEIFAMLGLFALIVIARLQGNHAAVSFISIGAFMAAAYKIIPGIVKIINISGQMKAYAFSVPAAKKISAEKVLLNKKTSPINSIKFIDVCFNYPGKMVLKDLSFELTAGDFIGLTGASGKGKTSILNLLLGFLEPEKGKILFNNIKVSGSEIKNYWPSVAYVRQQSFLIHDTLLKNITLQHQDVDIERLAIAMQISGVDKLITEFPEGPEKIITENGKNISGGQQQRIAIARAIYKDAGVILLDEPFNELDKAATQSLLEHFAAFAKKGNMVIMITHDRNTLAHCNKIISLDDC